MKLYCYLHELIGMLHYIQIFLVRHRPTMADCKSLKHHLPRKQQLCDNLMLINPASLSTQERSKVPISFQPFLSTVVTIVGKLPLQVGICYEHSNASVKGIDGVAWIGLGMEIRRLGCYFYMLG